MALENIKIQEITRKLAAGRFAYAMYEGKVARRAAKRGRPHYELVSQLNITPADKVVTREISATSQLGRLLLGS